MIGGVRQRGPIDVHDFLGLVVEEVQLHTNRTNVLGMLEERLTRRGVANLLAVLPEPDPHVALPRILDQLAQVGLRPALPESLEQVVLEPQLARQGRKLLHHVECAITAAIEIFPHGSSGPHPISIKALRKEPRISRW